MKTYPVPLETTQAKNGANTATEITFADLTAAGNTQTLSPLNVGAKMGVRLIQAELAEAFVSSDGTLISTSITIGDGNSAVNQLAATELNQAGTEVFLSRGVISPNPILYTADDTVDVFFTGTVAKALNSHTAGKLILYWGVYDARSQTL